MLSVEQGTGWDWLQMVEAARKKLNCSVECLFAKAKTAAEGKREFNHELWEDNISRFKWSREPKTGRTPLIPHHVRHYVLGVLELSEATV